MISRSIIGIIQDIVNDPSTYIDGEGNENNDEEKVWTQNKQLLSSSPYLSVEQNYNNNVFDLDDRHQNNASTNNSYIDDVGSHNIAAKKENRTSNLTATEKSINSRTTYRDNIINNNNNSRSNSINSNNGGTDVRIDADFKHGMLQKSNLGVRKCIDDDGKQDEDSTIMKYNNKSNSNNNSNNFRSDDEIQ